MLSHRAPAKTMRSGSGRAFAASSRFAFTAINLNASRRARKRRYSSPLHKPASQARCLFGVLW
jgi:hypothetical protein